MENWLKEEKLCREQEGTAKQELVRTIIDEILYKIETTVVRVNKSDGEITSNDKITNLSQTTQLLQPAKLKPAQVVIKEKKQQNIKNFFQNNK